MKYLCMIYSAEAEWPKLPPAEAEKWMAEYMAYGAELKDKGHYIMSQRLQPTHTATTVRVRDGKLSTTDGPFAETKEQFGGYYLIEANDLNEAIQLAARCPGARHGAVEVRPLG
jgi:hypothetical protein